ncbi:MAG: Na+/H+ antiporter subunit E [bacterium]|nr:Na+/H+ antiporter subunit E [Candidatus Margulisiibacteriota bacterium]
MKAKIITTFIFLLIVWFLFTFSLDPFSLLLGMIFSATISFFTYDIFIDDDEQISKGQIPKFHYFFAYILVILFEIFLGSLTVVYYVITMRIKPGMVRVKTGLKSKFAQGLLANSVTLTPGTVTVDLQDNELFVHWLAVKTADKKKSAELILGSFEKQLGRIFY